MLFLMLLFIRRKVIYPLYQNHNPDLRNMDHTSCHICQWLYQFHSDNLLSNSEYLTQDRFTMTILW